MWVHYTPFSNSYMSWDNAILCDVQSFILNIESNLLIIKSDQLRCCWSDGWAGGRRPSEALQVAAGTAMYSPAAANLPSLLLLLLQLRPPLPSYSSSCKFPLFCKFPLPCKLSQGRVAKLPNVDQYIFLWLGLLSASTLSCFDILAIFFF